MRFLHPTLLIPVLTFLFGSCAFREPHTAILWTDRPEFAVYAEYFNSSQDKYKIETRYFDSLTENLRESAAPAGTVSPDIVVGSWLKSASTRTLFRPLDYLFRKGAVNQDAFYARLLSLGRIEDKQYLFPVSFNIPALAFSRDNSGLLSNLFVIELEKIKTAGKAYNLETGGAYTRMGFSPSWNNEFLFVTATLFNTSFREADPLAWDESALEHAITYIRDWVEDANTSITMEDDFAFKYFFIPPSKLAITDRILFTYLDSAEFFTLAEEQRDNLDFRWIAREDTIPLSENSTYYGIYKSGKAKKAATAFTQWFFREETQRRLLGECKNLRMNETIFGIANGFSAMRTVTEQIFPQFYPSLLGHMPPQDSLSPPNILPSNWTTLKERVILPYLHNRIRAGADSQSLERQLADWLRINHESGGYIN
ncbi:lipoprotein [Spirochaetia bacterium]|nr:lipoprotein [Spirochaetia bacterium]